MDESMKFSAALLLIGTNEKVKAANQRAIRQSITDDCSPVDVFAVLESAGFEWNGSEWVEIDEDDPLTEALLEGDYAGIRKMFEELKAERDSANKRRSEVDAYIASLRKALEHYTDAEIVTSWGNQETQDDGAVARDALNSTSAGASLLYRLEYLEGMNLGRERVDALILELVQKHAPYVEYEELASPQLVEAIDKHISEMAVRITELTQPKQAETFHAAVVTIEDEYARAQLETRQPVGLEVELQRANAEIESLKAFLSNWKEIANQAANEVEELKAMLGRSQNRVSYLETMTLNPADLYAQLDVQTELIEAYSEATGGLQKAKEFQSTISGLEDMCVDLVKLIEKRNRHVEYWKRIARSRIDPQILNEKVVITPADRVDYEHIRTGVISISPEAHKVERERRCKAIEAAIRRCIRHDMIRFVGRVEIGYGVKEGAE